MKEYNLSIYKGEKFKVLSGADFGKEVREEFKMDELDAQTDEVLFYVPDYVYSLNSSFFSGLFQKSIRALGEQKFRQKYHFKCSSIIRENIDDGIFNVLNTLNWR